MAKETAATKAQRTAVEMERRALLSGDLLMGYCEAHDLWYEWDRVWAEGECPKCGSKPSARHGYQITTSRTWNPYATRSKIKNRRGIIKA